MDKPAGEQEPQGFGAGGKRENTAELCFTHRSTAPRALGPTPVQAQSGPVHALFTAMARIIASHTVLGPQTAGVPCAGATPALPGHPGVLAAQRCGRARHPRGGQAGRRALPCTGRKAA